MLSGFMLGFGLEFGLGLGLELELKLQYMDSQRETTIAALLYIQNATSELNNRDYSKNRLEIPGTLLFSFTGAVLIVPPASPISKTNPNLNLNPNLNSNPNSLTLALTLALTLTLTLAL